MNQNPRAYSQSKALWAITKASFKAIFNNPIAIVFSILFPIIFVLIFGSFGNSRGASYRVAIAENSDTTENPVYDIIKNQPQIRLTNYADSIEMNKDLLKGRLVGVLLIKKSTDTASFPRYELFVKTTSASNNNIGGFMQVLEYIKLKFELDVSGNKEKHISIAPPEIKEVRKYRAIDFILPGQLGFSILFSTLFGIAFTFFGLREQLVLKRFYATPVKRLNILLGIGMSRLFFQLMNVVVLILFGYFLMNFTLHHGLRTAVEILLMTVLMLFLLMGVGLIFSSIVKSDTSIPLLINLFGFPQMMLSGTFFSIDVFPKWLQKICNILPLTQYNDAIRKISFEGQGILECWKEIGILGIWMVITYIILVRVLKWE